MTNAPSSSNPFRAMLTRVYHRAGGGGSSSPPPTAEPEATVDYRFTLANERTFLAWIRTALGFLAGGVAIIHLLPEPADGRSATLVALPLLTLSLAISVISLRRWRSNDAAIERGAPLPRPSLPLLLAVSIAAMALVAGVVTVLSGMWPDG